MQAAPDIDSSLLADHVLRGIGHARERRRHQIPGFGRCQIESLDFMRQAWTLHVAAAVVAVDDPFERADRPIVR